MKYRNDLHNKTWFLDDPRLKKWIIQCIACGQYGRKANTPKNIPKYKFKENFPIMELNEDGICQDCQHSKQP